VACLAFALGVLLSFSSSATATLPGLVATVTQNGLSYGKDVGLLYLAQHLKGIVISLPDQSGSKDSIDYTISNIKVQDISIPAGAVDIQAGAGLVISTSSVSATLTANWHGREKIWPHPSGSGTATVAISQTSARTLVQFSVSNGHPTVNAAGTTASVGNLDLHFSGSHLDFLLNLLKGIFKGAIKGDAEKGIADTINSEIDTALNNVLASFPVDFKLGTLAEIDLSLVDSESFGANFMSLPLHGEFYAQNAHSEAPYQPTALPTYDAASSSAMAQLFVSSYVLETAGYVNWKAGAFSGVITAAMVPPQSPIQFNTTSFQTIIPSLYKLYPGWAMAARFQAIKAPIISFSAKSGILAELQSTIEFDVVSPKNGSLIPAFTLQLNSTADGTASVTGLNLTGSLTYFNSNYSLVATEIGYFDPRPLESLLTFVLEGVVVPFVNQYLKVGFPIPTVDGLSFVSPKVVVADGYLEVATQLNYPNPSLV